MHILYVQIKLTVTEPPEKSRNAQRVRVELLPGQMLQRRTSSLRFFFKKMWLFRKTKLKEGYLFYPPPSIPPLRGVGFTLQAGGRRGWEVKSRLLGFCG
jgi:hypothetical protein